MKRSIYLICLSFLILSLFSCSKSHSLDKTHNGPKNIILLISDGFGFNHIEAANFYEFGKAGMQAYEHFPVTYAMSTFSLANPEYKPELAWKIFEYVIQKPTDSAAAMTAISTGYKTYNGAIAVDSSKNNLETILERVEKYGKATGVVTSVQFCHATPAAIIAHNENRNNYEAISKEMLTRCPLEVIMGTGHPFFDENGQTAADTTFKYVGGKETWEKLESGVLANDSDGDGESESWHLIQDIVEFQRLEYGDTPERVVGIPKIRTTLQQDREGITEAPPFEVPLISTVPTLCEMAKAALNILDNDPDGFFLMIEGGAIDWASHDNQFGRMIEEQLDFNKTVEAVIGWLQRKSSWDETLVIVTADHECGYLTGPDSGPPPKKPANGEHATWNPVISRGKGKVPLMEWHHDGHTNSLIPFYAKGKCSELFHEYATQSDPIRGKYIDNTNIAHVLLSVFK